MLHHSTAVPLKIKAIMSCYAFFIHVSVKNIDFHSLWVVFVMKHVCDVLLLERS